MTDSPAHHGPSLEGGNHLPPSSIQVSLPSGSPPLESPSLKSPHAPVIPDTKSSDETSGTSHSSKPDNKDSEAGLLGSVMGCVPKHLRHVIYAKFFTWILLAGFMVFPGTFTSLQETNGKEFGRVGPTMLSAIHYVPLFIIGWLCTGIGVFGMCWVWYDVKLEKKDKPSWLAENIFMPGMLNSFAGLITTLTNVLSIHHARLSVSSTSTLFLTAGLTLICAMLVVAYKVWPLAQKGNEKLCHKCRRAAIDEEQR